MRGTVLIFLTTASLAATAQQLPPVFAGKTAKTDSLTRAYITPERVVWAHGSYSLWYLIIQHDWYMHGADATFLEKHRDYGAYCYLSYRHSLCHGWASGPTAWLSRHVLGVELVDAGCRTLRIRPHLGSLLWAEGSWPTPFGPVSIRHEKQTDGSISSKINAPAEVKILK